MHYEIEKILPFKELADKNIVLCEIKKGKDYFLFPIEIDYETGSIKKIDYPVYKKYKSVLKLNYTKNILLEQSNKLLKIIPIERIEKYKIKAKPIYSIRLYEKTLQEDVLLTLREKLGHNNGILSKAILLGTIDETPTFLPVYIDLLDEGKLKYSAVSEKDPIYKDTLSKLSPTGVTIISDNNLPIKKLTLLLDNASLRISSKDLISLREKIGITSNVESKKESPREHSGEITQYKYSPPGRETISEHISSITKINNLYAAYAKKHKQMGTEAISIFKEEIENIIFSADKEEGVRALFYTLRNAQRRYIKACSSLFPKEDPLWIKDTQKEKLYTPKEELFRNFILWTKVYASSDIKNGISFIDKDYISMPSSFIYQQELPMALPSSDFKLNMSSFNGDVSKEIIALIEDTLSRSLGMNISYVSHDFDPTTDKFPYAKIHIEKSVYNKDIEVKDSIKHNTEGSKMAKILIEAICSENRNETCIKSDLAMNREDENLPLPSRKC